MASTTQEEVASSSPKKAKEPVSETLPSPRVVLNPADCDLDFTIECDGVVGYGLNEEGFSYCWSGARANVGITGGKYCFGCKIVSEQHVVMDDIAREKWHLFQLGVSKGDDAVGSLGESKTSFCINGKIPNDGVFLTFWNDFDVGDTIVCCVDLVIKPKGFIGFFKNGTKLGTSHRLDVAGLVGPRGVISPFLGSLPWGSALFPHVLLKNIMVEMQFSVEDGLVPQPGFKPWALAVADGNGVIGPILSHPSDCEVLMMVGLPDSGKTTWAQQCVSAFIEKRYVLLRMDSIFDKMKVHLRRNNDDDDDGMFDRATEIFNRILFMAATIPRNYIIDERKNVYLNTRKDMLKPFADFQKVAVVVFPQLKELYRRSEKRFKEIGKVVLADNVKDMVANFVLPKSKDMPSTDEDEDENFDEVIFVEMNRDESQRYLDLMKQDIVSDTNNENVTKLMELEL